MKDNTDFRVGQFVRYWRFENIEIGCDQGRSTFGQTKDKSIGKIVAIHENNKRKLEIADRSDKKHFRVMPRNVIEIIPDDCVILTFEEKLVKEIGLLQLHLNEVKYFSNFGKEVLMEKLMEINDLFRSKSINSFLTSTPILNNGD